VRPPSNINVYKYWSIETRSVIFNTSIWAAFTKLNKAKTEQQPLVYQYFYMAPNDSLQDLWQRFIHFTKIKVEIGHFWGISHIEDISEISSISVFRQLFPIMPILKNMPLFYPEDKGSKFLQIGVTSKKTVIFILIAGEPQISNTLYWFYIKDYLQWLE
jgi:hypothetical protein